jgi:hypothetical protein
VVERKRKGERKVRVSLNEDQMTELLALFDAIPNEVKTRRQWESEEGKAFLRRAQEFVDGGVPVLWMAEELDLQPSLLSQSLSRQARYDDDETAP